MITYEELLKILRDNSDAEYRKFNSKISMISEDKAIGVKVPVLRKIAKDIAKNGKGEMDNICLFPNDYHEIIFIKFLVLAYCKLELCEFENYLDKLLPLIDNWAICDCFTATLKNIKNQRAEFLPYIIKCISDDREFIQRFGYICLLSHYTVPEYLQTQFDLILKSDCSKYYIHMAVAWLIAEILVKSYSEGIEFIKTCNLPKKTVNKAIQKARESFRLTDEQKNYLKTLKK